MPNSNKSTKKQIASVVAKEVTNQLKSAAPPNTKEADDDVDVIIMALKASHDAKPSPAAKPQPKSTTTVMTEVLCAILKCSKN